MSLRIGERIGDCNEYRNTYGGQCCAVCHMGSNSHHLSDTSLGFIEHNGKLWFLCCKRLENLKKYGIIQPDSQIEGI